MEAGIVVVGGGLAAASFATAYREAGGEDPVTLLSSDDRPPYNRPPLSKGFLRGDIEDEGTTYVHPARYFEEQVIELRLGATVTRLDTENRRVALADGDEVTYDRIVIASGATPRTLPLDGMGLPAVHVFRTLADADAVRREAADARMALVIGGSFIGAEVAASLRMLGLEVTLVEAGERLMPQLASEALSLQVADAYREHGVRLLLGDTIAELRANGRLLAGATTANGERIEAYLAVVGVGVEPSTAFLEGSGVELDNGVVVDGEFRASVEGVYAVGDVARFPDRVFGHPRRIEHWANAKAQGEHLGRAFAGDAAPFEEIPVFFTDLFGTKLQVLGDLEGGIDEAIVHGSFASGRLLGYYLREERLVGAVVAGQSTDVAEELKALLRVQPAAPERGRLADESLRPSAVFSPA